MGGLTSYSGHNYTVDYPDDWTTIEDDVAKSGYSESKWAANSSAEGPYELVDDTPGFSGGAEVGAQGIRQQVAKASDYQQLAWQAKTLPGGQAWYWQFTANGVEQSDTFFNECSTGYAVLESAPVGEWGSYQSLFSSITRSFSPSC